MCTCILKQRLTVALIELKLFLIGIEFLPACYLQLGQNLLLFRNMLGNFVDILVFVSRW